MIYFNSKGQILKSIALILMGLCISHCNPASKSDPDKFIDISGKAKMSKEKTRVIIQSDAEIDDQNSLCRLLLYANEMEIMGIFYNTTGGGAYDQWAVDRINAYGEIRDTLLVHAKGYPTKDYLLERLHRHDAPGVPEMIVNMLLDDDPRPIWYLIWGPGEQLTIGKVMEALKKRSEEEIDRALDKLRLFSIWSQSLEPCCGKDAVAPWFPNRIFTINSKDQFKAIAYRNDWKNTVDPPDAHYLSDKFQIEHFEGHGPLSDWYIGPSKGKPQTLEGDSPSFMHIIPVGLRSLEHPSYGGWGGRFKRAAQDSVLYVGAMDSDANFESRLYKPMSRWYEGSQNDYAARCDWATTGDFSKANHEPIAHLGHAEDLVVQVDSTVTLSAKDSWDPDGDDLNYKWWQYGDADSYEGTITMEKANEMEASFTVPKDAQGKDIHIILEVQDNGTPKLTRYRRVIVEVPSE